MDHVTATFCCTEICFRGRYQFSDFYTRSDRIIHRSAQDAKTMANRDYVKAADGRFQHYPQAAVDLEDFTCLKAMLHELVSGARN